MRRKLVPILGLILGGIGFSADALAAEPQLFVYTGAGCTGRDRMPRFETFLGRKADGIVDFVDISSWTNMLGSANWVLNCWSGQPYRMAMSVPMLVKDTNLEAGARGDYDQHFRSFANLLVQKGRGDAYLRIGWEFNGGWFVWAAAKNPDAWKSYFRRLVAIFRATPGSNFTIVWNPAQAKQQIAPDAVYPGDDVVDIIATDFYNRSYRPQDSDPVIRWQNYVEQPYGLNWLKDFAAQHGKPLAMPEWGTGTAPDGSGAGDDPLFIHNTAAWLRENNAVFHGYWDYQASDYKSAISIGQYPKSEEAFKEEFGKEQ